MFFSYVHSNARALFSEAFPQKSAIMNYSAMFQSQEREIAKKGVVEQHLSSYLIQRATDWLRRLGLCQVGLHSSRTT